MRIKVKNSGTIKLATKKDSKRGNLFVATAQKNIPFVIRRAYFINNLHQSKIRGNHAHKKTIQAIFCLNGSFVLNLDDGRHKQKVLLKNPEIGVLLGAKLWHSMSRFSKNCVILVLASAYYRESDYIRNYDEFKKIYAPQK